MGVFADAGCANCKCCLRNAPFADAGSRRRLVTYRKYPVVGCWLTRKSIWWFKMFQPQIEQGISNACRQDEIRYSPVELMEKSTELTRNHGHCRCVEGCRFRFFFNPCVSSFPRDFSQYIPLGLMVMNPAGPRYLNTTAVFFSEVWGFGVALPTSNGFVYKHVFFLVSVKSGPLRGYRKSPL